MSSPLRSPVFAHTAPLAAFLALTSFVPLIAVDNTMLPWWRHSPEQWLYPLQTVLLGVLVWLCRSQYSFRPFRGFFLAAVLGVLGIAWWCLPAYLWKQFTAAGAVVPDWCAWIGLAERKDGFDPSFFQQEPFWYPAALTMRFLRMAVVVPFVEEVFWRGFLMRYVQTEDGDFQKQPFGRHTWPAYFISTLGFMFAHDKTDWLGAIGFGSLMYVVAVRTKSLAACVFMHAVANLLLGIYVMTTRQWGFW